LSGNDNFKIKIKIHDFKKTSTLVELIDEFLRPEQYELVPDDGFRTDAVMHFNLDGAQDKNIIKREMFQKLYAVTGKRPDWGILTGVRPVKLAGEMYMMSGNRDAIVQTLTEDYFLTLEKAELITDMYIHQSETLGEAALDSVGVYIGIPFCPTRCLYCSFASNQVPDSEIERYMTALLKEISYVGRKMKESRIHTESIYIGGGTPTTLSAEQLDIMLAQVCKSFDMSRLKEFTVEAGRPDTITEEKLDVLRKYEISRISINPQSMKAETLERIGRNHTPADIIRAFEMANSKGFEAINADIIAGLPGEEPDDFMSTLTKVAELGATNITVHTLAVKRASRLKDIDSDYHYKVAEIVGEMLYDSREFLKEKGFEPYYLYRQKHMAGYYENTGYCLPGKDCLYNVRIMDEHQTIVALGAGGISKAYYPETNRLERVANVTNYDEYIKRIDEMCERKENNLFRRYDKC